MRNAPKDSNTRLTGRRWEERHSKSGKAVSRRPGFAEIREKGELVKELSRQRRKTVGSVLRTKMQGGCNRVVCDGQVAGTNQAEPFRPR